MTSHEHHSGQDPWHQLPEGLAAHLELEAALNVPIRNAALDRAALALDVAPAEVIDLGSGTGADTIALAERFPAARVHALDVSAELLERVASAAMAAGVADRVERRHINLDDDWPAGIKQRADLVWASMSMHHLADARQALQRVFTVLRPGGVLVLMELTGDEALAPHDLDTGSPGLWDRLNQAQPGHGGRNTADWARLLTQVGFTTWPRQEYEMIARADTADGARFLEMQLRSRRNLLIDSLAPKDLAALDQAIAAIDNGTSQVSFRSGRTVWLAVRPPVSAPAGPNFPTAVLSEKTDAAGIAAAGIEGHLVTDVAVVGGGVAGLAAAVALARSRRKVVIIDAGEPRNAPAGGAHNVLGNEGISPLALLEAGRAEAQSYGVQIISGRATTASGALDEFTVGVNDGARQIRARRIILATGLVDDLPDIPGVATGWGHTVLHCPFCHGWEVRDQRIAILARGEVTIHHAMLFSQLSSHVTVFLHDAPAPSEEQRDQLAALRVAVVRPKVERLLMDGTQVRAVQVEDGRTFDTDAVVVAPRFNARTELYETLGGGPELTPFGTQIPTDARGMTQVPGVWAAGNASQTMAMVAAAAASGVTTGAAVHGDLAVTDLDRLLMGHPTQHR